MLQGTSKRWHVVSLGCATIMPTSSRFGYVDDQENPPAGRG